MIRRRVIDQLKTQQWVAVGIELVIVVLGVFIGLQASNWNQQRTLDRQAANFAERLKPTCVGKIGNTSCRLLIAAKCSRTRIAR